MELNDLINKIHKLIEAKELRKIIKQEEMAKRIGVKSRTYTEYIRGTNKPLAMKALLNMLNELDNDDILKVVRSWKTTETKEAE
jgi:transcriptional regulator with XRE-family HTH domain